MKTKEILLTLLFAAMCLPLFVRAQVPDPKPIRNFQMSVLPFVGTEGREALNHRYQFSLNLLAGITGGLDGFEAGGLVNVNKGRVKGLQLSGFGNIVNGDLEGFQGTGFLNVNNGNVRAFQGAGFMNINSGAAEGFIGSGFANLIGGNAKSLMAAGFANVIGGSYEGLLGAGFGNFTDGGFIGIQGSGFINVTGGEVKGIQGAGFMNVTGGAFEGIQGAGFANISGGHARGVQMAGFMNVNNTLEGIQMAGFMNVADKVKGLQLGFLNIANSVDGVPVGFLSIVKNGGYRQFEIAGSDAMHIGASFRIGVPVFYNIFSIGTRPFDVKETIGAGYGVGSEIKISEPMAVQIELHATQLNDNLRKWNNHLDLVGEFRILSSLSIGHKFSVFAGPVLYNHTYEYKPESGITGSEIAPYSFSESLRDDYMSKWWIGARAGVRLRIN